VNKSTFVFLNQKNMNMLGVEIQELSSDTCCVVIVVWGPTYIFGSQAFLIYMCARFSLKLVFFMRNKSQLCALCRISRALQCSFTSLVCRVGHYDFFPPKLHPGPFPKKKKRISDFIRDLIVFLRVTREWLCRHLRFAIPFLYAVKVVRTSPSK